MIWNWLLDECVHCILLPYLFANSEHAQFVRNEKYEFKEEKDKRGHCEQNVLLVVRSVFILNKRFSRHS